jgi:glycerol-3-phosphate acyltransferase PlsY
MVATCGGALLGLAPLVGLVGAIVWVAVFALTPLAAQTRRDHLVTDCYKVGVRAANRFA